jgi:hypothetical protein
MVVAEPYKVSNTCTHTCELLTPCHVPPQSFSMFPDRLVEWVTLPYSPYSKVQLVRIRLYRRSRGPLPLPFSREARIEKFCGWISCSSTMFGLFLIVGERKKI